MTPKYTEDLWYRVRLLVHGLDAHGELLIALQHKEHGCLYCNRLMDFTLSEIRRHESENQDKGL